MPDSDADIAWQPGGPRADDRQMPLSITTDHDTITALLDERLAADPVRATTLGTIRATLHETAWAAWDGDGLAVRSAAVFPVVVSGRWGSAARGELVGLLGALPDLRGVSGPLVEVEPLVSALSRPGRAGKRMAQRLFRLDELAEPVGVPGSALRAGVEHRALVRDWYLAFSDEADAIAPRNHDGADAALDGGWCWLWLDATGAPVSLAARRAVVVGSARVGPVYTPPDRRGNGYGSAVTAAATADILHDGAIPVLFTELANPTSNKIYQLLGYRPVEDRLLAIFD